MQSIHLRCSYCKTITNLISDVEAYQVIKCKECERDIARLFWILINQSECDKIFTH